MSDGWNRKAVSSGKQSCLERRRTTAEGTVGDFPSNTGPRGGQYMSAVSKCVPRSAHPSRCVVKKGFSDPISSENALLYSPSDSFYNKSDVFKILRNLS